MKKLLTAMMFALPLACGGTQKPAGSPAQELDMLITLYQEDRAKFVLQKQQMQEGDCGRVKGLAQAAREKEAAANMTPGDTSVITQVRMEMDQAEQACLAK